MVFPVASSAIQGNAYLLGTRELLLMLGGSTDAFNDTRHETLEIYRFHELNVSTGTRL